MFKKIFEAYGGNYDETLGRFLGKEELYLKFLKKFFEDESMEQLGAAIRNGSQEEIFTAAHTLKGVAGNMGLTPLSDAARAVEEPFRRNEGDKVDSVALYQKVQQEYQRAKQLLDALEQSKI